LEATQKYFLCSSAGNRDFCHELVRLIMGRLGDSVRVVDETRGFAYMDNRDLIGRGARGAGACLILGCSVDFPGLSRPHQQREHPSAMREGERLQSGRKREDDVEVVHVEDAPQRAVRGSIQRASARLWHFGQCRLRHEW